MKIAYVVQLTPGDAKWADGLFMDKDKMASYIRPYLDTPKDIKQFKDHFIEGNSIASVWFNNIVVTPIEIKG